MRFLAFFLQEVKISDFTKKCFDKNWKLLSTLLHKSHDIFLYTFVWRWEETDARWQEGRVHHQQTVQSAPQQNLKLYMEEHTSCP